MPLEREEILKDGRTEGDMEVRIVLLQHVHCKSIVECSHPCQLVEFAKDA